MGDKMKRHYFIKNREVALILIWFTIFIGYFLVYFLYTLEPYRGFYFFWSLLFIWNFVFILGIFFFRRCMLYRVDIEREGIRLYFIRVCDTVIDANYRDRDGRRVKEKHIEINREEGWVLIRWEEIEEIRVGRKLTEPKCNVILKGGHRVKFFNFVDKEIINAIKMAYDEYKRALK